MTTLQSLQARVLGVHVALAGRCLLATLGEPPTLAAAAAAAAAHGAAAAAAAAGSPNAGFVADAGAVCGLDGASTCCGGTERLGDGLLYLGIGSGRRWCFSGGGWADGGLVGTRVWRARSYLSRAPSSAGSGTARCKKLSSSRSSVPGSRRIMKPATPSRSFNVLWPRRAALKTVSYTHLTLPTICSV